MFSPQEQERKWVENAIIQAFEKAQFPGPRAVARAGILDEEMDAVEQLLGLAPYRFNANYEFVPKAVSWITPEAFRYFIGGFMVYLLRCDLESACDLVVTDYLLPATEQMLKNGYDDSRFVENTSVLDDEQKRAIALFWKFAREHYPEKLKEEFWDYNEESRYWDRYL